MLGKVQEQKLTEIIEKIKTEQTQLLVKYDVTIVKYYGMPLLRIKRKSKSEESFVYDPNIYHDYYCFYITIDIGNIYDTLTVGPANLNRILDNNNELEYWPDFIKNIPKHTQYLYLFNYKVDMHAIITYISDTGHNIIYKLCDTTFVPYNEKLGNYRNF